MKKIVLRNAPNVFALVDDEDYEKVSKYEWSCHNGGYAFLARKAEGLPRSVLMHRYILDAKPGQFVHHRDSDRLNNTRGNITICTLSENNHAMSLSAKNTSGFKGVSWFKPQKKWRATIVVGKKQKSLGYFDSKIDAARAYNKAASINFGEYAILNDLVNGGTENDKNIKTVEVVKRRQYSQYLNVTWNKDRRRWVAYFDDEWGRVVSCHFENELEAAYVADQIRMQLLPGDTRFNVLDKEGITV